MNSSLARPILIKGTLSFLMKRYLSCINGLDSFKNSHKITCQQQRPQHHSHLPLSTLARSSTATGLYRLLNEEQRQILEEQRELTETAKQLAKQVGVSVTQENNLLEQLATFCVVVAGEFNAGKSTIINALLGQKVLRMGSLPTTDTIHIISHEPAPAERYPNVNFHTHTNSPLLQDLTLVDTPGTNAVLHDHTATTLKLLPSADLILFTTSADRPFPESERKLLQSIAKYRKNIAIIVNKMDILEQTGGDHGSEEKLKVIQFVAHHAREWLGAQPIVIGVSARDALSTKLTAQQNSKTYQRSNFDTLESFLKDTLTTEAKIQSKLTSPLGVIDGLMNACVERLQEDQREQEADNHTIKMLHSQLEAWRTELKADMQQSKEEMLRPMVQTRNRCRFPKRLSLFHLYYICLFDFNQLERQWDKTQPILVKDSLKETLQHMAEETADYIAVRGRAQGQAIIEFLGKRPVSRNQSLVGSITAASRFEETRNSLLESLKLSISRTLEVDEDTENRHFLDSIRIYAKVSMFLNCSAMGSISALATHMIDPWLCMALTGGLVMSSGLVFTLGIARFVDRFNSVWDMRIHDFSEAIDVISAKELERIDRRVRDSVAPYTRFVGTEQDRLSRLKEQCDQLLTTSHRLRNRINKLY